MNSSRNTHFSNLPRAVKSRPLFLIGVSSTILSRKKWPKKRASFSKERFCHQLQRDNHVESAVSFVDVLFTSQPCATSLHSHSLITCPPSLWPFPLPNCRLFPRRGYTFPFSRLSITTSISPQGEANNYKEERPSTRARPSTQKVPTTAWPALFSFTQPVWPPKKRIGHYHSIQSGPSQLQAVRGSAIS